MTALGLLVAFSLPAGVHGEGRDATPWRLLWSPWAQLGRPQPTQGSDILLAIGFLGLSVVAAIAIALSLRTPARTPSLAKVARVNAVLLCTGTIIATLAFATSLGDMSTPAPLAVLAALGAAGAHAWLVFGLWRQPQHSV